MSDTKIVASSRNSVGEKMGKIWGLKELTASWKERGKKKINKYTICQGWKVCEENENRMRVEVSEGPFCIG